VALNRRLLVISLGVAVVVSGVGGYALSRGDSSTTRTNADDSVILDQPGGVQEPTIGTNARVKGRSLPTITLQDNDGNQVSTADLIGRPLIINVWFSTCGACKQELPAFAKVHAELGDTIRFVGVNPSDTPETNASFAHDRGVSYELLRDPDGSFVAGVGIVAFPVTLFVAADGTIVRQTGVLDEATLRADAEELLG
jgi:peroxiredoxin